MPIAMRTALNKKGKRVKGQKACWVVGFGFKKFYINKKQASEGQSLTVTDSLTHSDKSNNSVGIRISICHIISYFIIRQNVVLDSLFFFFFFMGLDSLNSCPINCLIQPQFFHHFFFLFWRESIIVLTTFVIFF